VANNGYDEILRIDPGGDASVFASGFGDAQFLADEIPEPSSLLLLGLGLSALALCHRVSLPRRGSRYRRRRW